MTLNIQEEEKRLKDAQRILVKVSEQEKIVKRKKAEFEKEDCKLEDMKKEYLKLTVRKDVVSAEQLEKDIS
jgi:hypothetical protein